MDERTKDIPTADEGEDQLMYVEDLANAEDYWLSLTDAARITRRQEVTIRRWVAAGTLPVCKQRMGLNKRTRHIRASDLGKLTPIIDFNATISGAAAHLDLLSIPSQQAQILATHQDLTQQVARLVPIVTGLERQQMEQQQHHREALGLLYQEFVVTLDQQAITQEQAVTALHGQFQQLADQHTLQTQQLTIAMEDAATQRQRVEQDFMQQLHLLQTQLAVFQQQVQSDQEVHQHHITLLLQEFLSQQHAHLEFAQRIHQTMDAVQAQVMQLLDEQAKQREGVKELFAHWEDQYAWQQRWNRHLQRLLRVQQKRSRHLQ